MAVAVTVTKGYDLGYVSKNQAQTGTEKTTGGYCINAAQAGEPPVRWGAGRGRTGLRRGPGGRAHALERVCAAGRRGWPVAGTLLS